MYQTIFESLTVNQYVVKIAEKNMPLQIFEHIIRELLKGRAAGTETHNHTFKLK